MSMLKEVHRAGLDSIDQLCMMTGISRQTLANWRKNRPDAFRLILKGAAAEARENVPQP